MLFASLKVALFWFQPGAWKSEIITIFFGAAGLDLAEQRFSATQRLFVIRSVPTRARCFESPSADEFLSVVKRLTTA